MSGSGIKTVFGGGSVGFGVFKTVEECHEVFKILKAHGVETIDTAQLYGDSEKILGEAKAGEQFIIDTKTPGPRTRSSRTVTKAQGFLDRSMSSTFTHLPKANPMAMSFQQ
jgi:diketogulonate reductase-like aldo/keto reductase